MGLLTTMPAAAHGARSSRDSLAALRGVPQPPAGEASARLTYFSFRITCFHFPSRPPRHAGRSLGALAAAWAGLGNGQRLQRGTCHRGCWALV